MSDTTQPKKRKSGAGRPTGSNSFVLMSMEQLNKLFGHLPPTFKVMVYRKQMEGFGLNDLVTGSASELKDSIAGQSVETAPAVKCEEL
jgi:hypothetical protein